MEVLARGSSFMLFQIAQGTKSQGMFYLQRLCVSTGPVHVRPRGAYRSANREQMEPQEPMRLLQL